jgi:glycosyltransferase involved in cell wall biosynthesis
VVIGESPSVSALRALGIVVEVIGGDGLTGHVAASIALRRVVRRRRPRVIHANGVRSAFVSGLATVGWSVPVLWLKVDTAWDGPGSYLVARLCTETVGLSEAAIGSLRRRNGIRTRVVAGGIPELDVDPDRGRKRLTETCGWPTDSFRVALSGRLCPGKGQLELIEAAPRVLSAFPDVRFAVIGRSDPSYPDYDGVLRRRITELHLGSAFALLTIDAPLQAIELCSGADLVVAPSIQGGRRWREGFGLVVAESMQLGVPVVAYESGSLPEVLGQCGRLVREGDREGLASAMHDLIANEAERQAAAECGRLRAHELFRIERAAAELCTRYAELATEAT